MAYNNHQQVPFWDFINSFDNHGAGVDHPAGEFGGHGPQGAGFSFGGAPFHGAGFPFGMGGPQGWGQGWGRGGHGPHRNGGGHGGRGRHGHRRDGRDGSAERHAHGSRDGSPNGEHSEGEAREEHHGPRGPRGSRRHGRGSPSGEHSEGEAREGRHGGHRGPRGFGRHGRGGHHRGGPGGPGGPGGAGGFGHHGRRGPRPPFGGPQGPGGFDMSALMESLSGHPLAQAFRSWAEQSGAGAQRSGETLVPEDADAENSFIPPIDIFSTEKQYILHVSLPGAKKEDVGVNWDEEKGVLNLAGVVYRHGDEEFLQTLAQSERKVGVFERTVKLPPGNGEKEEIDGDAITAKLEDGVLIVSVPKIEKEWTEVKKVDIE